MDSRALACVLGALALGSCTQEAGGNMFDPSTSGAPPTGTTSNSSPTGETTETPTGTTSTATDGKGVTSSGADSSSTAAEESSSGNFGSLCGNGTIEGNEECDCGDDGECSKAELGDNACENIRDPLVPGILTGGDLGCNPASCRYDTTQCVYCGDGEINGNETCESDIPITNDCVGIGEGTAGELSCQASCQLDTTACTECGYSFDFVKDDCPGDWFVFRTAGAASQPTWACGNPGPHATGPGTGETGVWGTGLDGNYASSESGYVASPAIDLSNCEDQTVSLTIRHWYNFQGNVGNDDGGVVQVANTEPLLETSWTTIAPVAGSLYIDGVDADFPPVDGAAAFSGLGDEQEWVESVFDITDYANSEFYVRFVIGSDGTTELGGWYIDNLEILGSGE